MVGMREGGGFSEGREVNRPTYEESMERFRSLPTAREEEHGMD